MENPDGSEVSGLRTDKRGTRLAPGDDTDFHPSLSTEDPAKRRVSAPGVDKQDTMSMGREKMAANPMSTDGPTQSRVLEVEAHQQGMIYKSLSLMLSFFF